MLPVGTFSCTVETMEVAPQMIENIKLEDGTNAVEDDDFVDPWTVSSKSNAGVDYDKLISE